MEFKYELNDSDADNKVLKLSGYFDEFSNLPEGIDLKDCKIFTVDFQQIEFINSGGIKLWVNFVDTLDGIEGMKVHFKNCKRTIIDQINLIDGFLPKNGEVTSLFIPVFCNKCENSIDVFHDLKKDGKDTSETIEKAENQDCENHPGCRKYFELDITSDHFFRFIKD